jgi:hypothetical protein
MGQPDGDTHQRKEHGDFEVHRVTRFSVRLITFQRGRRHLHHDDTSILACVCHRPRKIQPESGLLLDQPLQNFPSFGGTGLFVCKRSIKGNIPAVKESVQTHHMHVKVMLVPGPQCPVCHALRFRFGIAPANGLNVIAGRDLR